MKTIETYLPVFPGFYNTFFECDESDVIDSYNQENDTNFDYDNFEWDYSEYYDQIARNCCDAIETLLKKNNIVQSIKFQNIVSPLYYNYSNDGINVEVEINIENLILFIAQNKEEFDTYIKENYSSRDGFISFHSNDGNEWLKSLVYDDFKKPEHCFGALLEFICDFLIYNQCADSTAYWLYEQMEKYDYCEPNYTLIESDNT